MDEIEQIKKDIQEIKERNARVEMDKAWEMSMARKLLVAVLTYIVIVLFFFFAELPSPFLNAIVPTLGFILSTLSISYFKKVWIKNRKEQK
jgi:preprotein translocase subunit SecF